jgi:hypothetical protein
MVPTAQVGLASEARSTTRTRRSRKDDDEDSDSTELAEVLPDIACGLQDGKPIGQRSREQEAPSALIAFLSGFLGLRLSLS